MAVPDVHLCRTDGDRQADHNTRYSAELLDDGSWPVTVAFPQRQGGTVHGDAGDSVFR